MDKLYEKKLLDAVEKVRRDSSFAAFSGVMYGKMLGLSGEHAVGACFTGLMESIHTVIESSREAWEEASPDHAEEKKQKFDILVRGLLQRLCDEFGYEVVFHNEVREAK